MKKIKCDQCGAEFETDEVVVKNRTIEQDEKGNDVIEKFFECPLCAKKYRITVMDREQMLRIQQMTMTALRANRAAKGGQASRAKQYMRKHDELKEAVRERAKMLKEKYKET